MIKSKFLSSRLSPFQYPSFRNFFLAQSFSMIGTWANDLARAWLIIQLMGKAGALGSVLLAAALPTFILILHGGVLVDKVDVRRLMMQTKAALAVLSLTLAVAIEFYQVHLWMLIAFAFLEGVLVAFDNPSFQALTVRLVPRTEFQQAMSLNSTNFHAARMMGPVFAGFLMYLHGPSLVFLFDAISFLGVILVLRKVDLRAVQRKGAEGKTPVEALRDGFRYFFGDRVLRVRLYQLFLNISLVFPLMMVVFRTYIQRKFHLNAEEFGFVFMFPAMGAVAGALSFTVLQPKQPTRVLKASLPLTFLALVSVPAGPNVFVAAALMTLTGFALYLSLASLTVSLHLKVDEDYRGRLSGIIGLCFASIGPMMSFPVGAYADWIGFPTAIISLSVLFGIGSLLLALSGQWKHEKLAKTAPIA